MATAGKITKNEETTTTESLQGTAGVGVTEVQGPVAEAPKAKKGADKAAEAAQATIDKYTANKTAKANADVAKLGEDKA